ncbi:PAS domain-containing protein, partial [Ramlibacter aquaticus]
PDLQAVFAALPGPATVLLAPDAPDFTIVATSRVFQDLTHTDASLLGQPLFQAFSDANPANPQATGVANLRASLETVLATGQPHRMETQRYDLCLPDGRWEARHWAPRNTPVFAPDGSLQYILHTADDVTGDVHAREALHRAQERTARMLTRMSDGYLLLDDALRVIDMNPAAERLVGRTREALLGLAPWEAFPALQDTELVQALRDVVQARRAKHVQHLCSSLPGERHLEVDAHPTAAGGAAVFWRDVTERVRSEEALRLADRRKDEFLATLAHELRNPLAPVRTGIHILRRAGNPEMAQRTLASMERQMTHLVRLIDDLMDVSRISRGKVELQRAPVALNAIVEAALEHARPAIEAAGQALDVSLLPGTLTLHADATRLVQVLGNLLNNASKYTPDGGRIGLAVTREDSEAVVRVSDSGMGIAPGQLAQVFEPFTQLERPGHARGQGGLGIGLSISQRLVRLHGGALRVHSEGRGRGATFSVHLPLVPPAG